MKKGKRGLCFISICLCHTKAGSQYANIINQPLKRHHTRMMFHSVTQTTYYNIITLLIYSENLMNMDLSIYKVSMDSSYTIVNPVLVNAARSEYFLSLAYEQLEKIPKDFLSIWADKIINLDLTNNNFKDLSFLQNFKKLRTLVLDSNTKLDYATFPPLEKLQRLCLNNCGIVSFESVLLMLQCRCPNLKHLSIMTFPYTSSSCARRITTAWEKRLRIRVAAIIPQLTHYDGIELQIQGKPRPSMDATHQPKRPHRKLKSKRKLII